MDADQLAALAATPAAQHCMLVEGSAVTLNEYFGVLPFADVITADASIADQYAFDEADVGVSATEPRQYNCIFHASAYQHPALQGAPSLP